MEFNIGNIPVRPISEILNHTPSRRGYGLADDHDACYILDAQGETVGTVSAELYIEEGYFPGETVQECLNRLNGQKIGTFVLRHRYGYVIKNHESVGGDEKTLYRIPRSCAACGHLESEWSSALPHPHWVTETGEGGDQHFCPDCIPAVEEQWKDQ